MKRILFFFAATILFSGTVFSQGSNCASATPFCGGSTSFPNNTATLSQSGPSYGCLATQPNPAWFFVKTTAAGNMVYNISQVNGSGVGIDVDFVAWGPFASMANACNSLTGSCSGDHFCSGNIEDCSYNPAAVETMTLVSPGAGFYYVILITNYANVAGTITFNQTSGPTSDCSITCPSVTAGNGILLGNGANVPSTVACSDPAFSMFASDNTPFGNPITPGIMISYTSNTNSTLQVNWIENSVYQGCFGATPCTGGTIPTNTNMDNQISFMSPSLTQQIQFCETSTSDGDFSYIIVDVSSGLTLNSGTWVTDGACTTVTFPPGTISGSSTWSISPACPGCLSTTDWGASVFNPGVAPAGTYNICYSFDPPGSCPTYTYCQNITVTNPNNPAWTGPSPMCATAGSINLNTLITGTTGGTWSGTGVSGSTFNPASSGAGTFSITYTVGSGTCSATQAHNITVTPGPTTSNAGPDQSVCATSTTLAGNTAAVGTGTWTLVSGAGSVTTPGSPTSGVTGLGVGPNVFQWTIASAPCTPSSDQVTIIGVSPPTAANAGPDQTVCASTATLAGNTATSGTGTWTLVSGAGSVSTPSSPTSGVTGLGVGTNVFQWTITNAPCTASSDQITITRTAAPTTSAAGSDQSICGTSATLAGNGVITGTGVWTLVSGAGTVTTPSSPTSGVTGLGTGPNVFQWTISNAPCPPSTDQVTITAAPAPTTSNAGADQTVCATTATLAGNTATTGTGTWTVISGGATVTTPGSPTSGVTGLAIGANVFQWTIANAPCAASSDQITITRTASPTTSAAGPDQNVCATTATLAANTATVGTGVWTLVSGGGSITSPTSPNSGVTGLGVGPNVFQWTISNAPCTPSTDQVTITSVSPPTTANAGPDQSVCATTATLAGNAATTGTGTWTVISGGGTVTTPGSPTSGVTGLGVGANVFQWTISNAPCSPTTDQITITRTATPTTAAAGPDQTTCATTATLAGNTAGTGTGVWTLVSGAGTITSPTAPNSGVTGLGVGPNVFQWTISNPPCAPSTDQITINHPAPDNAAFTYSSSTYCQTGTDPASTITGTPGGTFSAVPAGLVFLNTTTGLIDVSASALNTYTVTYTTSGTCPATSSVNITITSAPAATFSYAGPYCQNGANPTPTFSGGGSAGTFSSTAGLVFVNVNTGQINLTTSTPGTYTVTNSIAASGGCSPATATASITINPAPVVTATPPTQTICSGSATNIALTSSLGGTTYSWTVSQTGVSGGSSGIGTPIAQTLSTLAATAGSAVYTVNSTSGGCAGAPITVNITVNPLPTVTPSPATQTICSGSATSISLSGSLAGTTFSWLTPGTTGGASGGAAGSGASITQTLTTPGPLAGTVTYTVVPTANSCPGTTSTVVITVNPTPVVTASPMSSSICSGATTAITLSSTTPGTTFTWVAANGAGISGAVSGTGTSIAQTLINATGSAGNATYTITPSANGCPGLPIVVTVTVNPVPTAAATPSSQTICSGSATSISLSGSIAGTTFAWGAPTQTAASGGAAGSGSTITQTLLASGTGAGTVQYTVIPSAGSCAGPSITVSITVNPVPFVTATPLTSTICSGATSSVSLTSFTAGTTFSWTATNGTNIAGATSGSGTTISQVLANSGSTLSAATYTVTPTAAGCPGSPVTITVNVNPVPNVIASPLSQTICSGSTSGISLSSAVSGTTFSWTAPTQTGASGGSAGSGSSIAQVLNATGTTAGTVTYNVTPSANGCSGSSVFITVTVEPNPVATATPSSAAICSGTSTSVALSSTVSGTTYTWTASASGATGQSAGSGNTIAQVLTATGTTPGTVTYNVTATTAAGCTSTIAPIVITVNPSPDITATPSNATICSGATTGIVLTSSVAGATFSWTVVQTGISGASAGSGSSISQVLSTLGTTPGSAVYTVTPSASGCASGSPVTVTITVNPLPDVTATPAIDTICTGAGTSISLSSNLPSSTFDWTVVQSGVTGASAGSGATISNLLNLTGASPGTVVYTITPTNSGCSGTPINVTVNVNPIDNAAFTYPSSTFCQTGTDPSATISGTSGGTFSASPAGLIIDPVTGLIDISASTLGTYSITYQTNGLCPNASGLTITITTAPDAVFSYSASVCSTDPNPTPTFGSGASAGIFTASPTGLVFVDSTTGEINLGLSTAGTYTITNSIAPGGGCAAASATGTITISQAATVDAGLNDTICEQAVLNLSGTMGGSASSILWTTAGTGTFGDSLNPVTTYTPSAADVASGLVVLTITTDDPAGACASVNDFAVLYITPLDSADFSYSGSTFCASGTDPIPTVTGMPGGMFTSSPAGLVFINALTGEIDLSASALGTYSVVYSTNGPCPSADTTTVTISTAPSATFTFTAGVTAFCQTSPNPAPVFGSGASAGVFTASPSGLVFVSATSGVIDLGASAPGTYVLTNTIVAAGGCASSVDSLTITINQAATANAGPDTAICAGSVITVNGVIGGSATGLTWTSSGSGTFGNDTIGSTTYTPSVADTTSGSVTLYVTTNDPTGACGAVVDSMVLTLISLPSSPIIVAPAAYCAGSTVNPITATGSGGTISWYADPTLTTFLSNANPYTPTGVTTNTSFWVTETVGACASGVASQVDITFNPLPVADTSATTTTNADCGQATGSITGVTVTSGASPFTYNWQDALGATVATTLDLTGVGPGVYTLTITDANGCSTTVGGGSLFNVTSTSGVTASFTSDVITGEKPLPVLFTNTSIGGVTYVWDFGTGDTSHLANPGYTFTNTGVFTVCLIADNGGGCADTACASIDVFINSTFVIPNVFTPNDDNVNDIFTVKNVGLETLDAEIFNRWGQKEYEWHTTNGGWDGRTAAGVYAPDGIYYFIISATGIDGKEYFEKGAFTLIR